MNNQSVETMYTSENTLAGWLLIGLSFSEVKVSPLGDLINVLNNYTANVLGLAMIGKAGSPQQAVKQFEECLERGSSFSRIFHIALILNVPEWFAMKLEFLHKKGLSPKEIADRLKSGQLTIED